ncbi:hypothetical protein [Parvularcula lutaonensis]|uniref:DoxX family protein n=1 Tax=Parvularcula lutaonensis TaxID=491923 RepID=A0ABV7MBM1_9PROT|nr:hypothetical protein [Parvularcula lutaonensis]
MGSLFIVFARALIVAPFLVTGVLGFLNYAEGAAAMAQSHPQLGAAYPVLMGAQLLAGVVILLGLPFHRILAVIAGVILLGMAAVCSPFWNFIGEEAMAAKAMFLACIAHAGGLFLIAAMPKN